MSTCGMCSGRHSDDVKSGDGGVCFCLWFFLLFGCGAVDTGRGCDRAATACLGRRSRVLIPAFLVDQVQEEFSIDVGVTSADQGVQ